MENKETIDLSICAREPIHIPGRIQSHGFLVAYHLESGLITYLSDNVDQFVEVEAGAVINNSISNFLQTTRMHVGNSDLQELIKYGIDHNFENLNPIKVNYGKTVFNLIAHISGKFMVLEFEPEETRSSKELQAMLGIAVSKILGAATLQQTLQSAASLVKDIIDYDRVMIYKFWEDDHGEVVAEERKDFIDSFLGLHYPASDIPKQARELYKVNLVRLIADVDSTASGLIVTDKHFSNIPIDLTHSTLRAVSPVHIEYLKNMQVKASFSVSIVVKDKLWGLIACHNNTPKFIDYNARNSIKLIGKIISSSLEFREEEERKELMRKYQESISQIVANSIKEWDITDGLVGNSINVLKVANAEGAALLFENNLYSLGNAPTEQQIRNLILWLNTKLTSNIFHTDNLSSHYPPAKEYVNECSGLMVCRLSKEMQEYILWFKPQVKKNITWAGNPNKPATEDASGNLKISPRLSFEMWAEETEGYSQPWTTAEIGSAMKLREEISYLINQKANQVRKLNEELQKAYDELDTFSYTISHDLKTPLATIKNYSEILLEDYADLSSDAKNILNKVIKSTDRMNLLIKEVLSYTRIERQELNFSLLDMQSIISNIKSEVAIAYKNSSPQISVGKTPDIFGDNVMIYQVFSNLISNAVKYSSKNGQSKVEINGEVKGDEIIYTIKDNGIGIDMLHGDFIFVLFKRMENARSYEGTGVGLAIVKRIIEKHNGKIWYESELNNGTIFYLSFKKEHA